MVQKTAFIVTYAPGETVKSEHNISASMAKHSQKHSPEHL